MRFFTWSFVLWSLLTASAQAHAEKFVESYNAAVDAERAAKVQEAKAHYGKACTRKFAEGCFDLARLARVAGEGAEERHWFGRACGFGRADACHDLGTIERRLGNLRKAASSFATACRLGYQDGCVAARQRAAKLLPETPQALRSACKKRDELACFKLERTAIDEAQLAQTRKLMAHLCEEGRSILCARLGFGAGERGDFGAATVSFTQACDRGSDAGCWMRGRMEETVSASPAASHAARRWYLEACKLGSKIGCIAAEEPNAALRWSKAEAELVPRCRAADTDAGPACFQLAILERERGSRESGSALFATACAGGYVLGCAFSAAPSPHAVTH